jgi:hypothetical protein
VLPGVIVVGAMKCGTSAAHAYLDAHPCIAMSRTKELNFFNGPCTPPGPDPDQWWRTGQWHRGLEWYAAQLAPDAPPDVVRGESSPAYTSPTCPEVPARMAAVVPDVRIVYLVRDPVERAASQWSHHRRDGAEPRPLAEAVLDPGSQYVARSRYHERIEPFLEHFDRQQLHVVVAERLARDRDTEIARLYAHVGVDDGWRDRRHGQRFHVGSGRTAVDTGLRDAFADLVRDDVERLRRLLDDDLAEWSS